MAWRLVGCLRVLHNIRWLTDTALECVRGIEMVTESLAGDMFVWFLLVFGLLDWVYFLDWTGNLLDDLRLLKGHWGWPLRVTLDSLLLLEGLPIFIRFNWRILSWNGWFEEVILSEGSRRHSRLRPLDTLVDLSRPRSSDHILPIVLSALTLLDFYSCNLHPVRLIFHVLL